MPESKKTKKPDPLDAMIEASAQLLGLTIKPKWTAGVRGNLETSLRLGRLVADFPLPDDMEPAPVFEA